MKTLYNYNAYEKTQIISLVQKTPNEGIFLPMDLVRVIFSRQGPKRQKHKQFYCCSNKTLISMLVLMIAPNFHVRKGR